MAKKENKKEEQKKSKGIPQYGADVKEILQKAQECTAHYEQTYKNKWEFLDNVYRGIRKRGEYQDEWQSNLVMMHAFGIINQEQPMIMAGLYPQDDFFLLEPTMLERGDVNLQASAVAMQTIMERQSDEMHLYRSFYWAVLDSLVFSLGVLKLTWKYDSAEKEYVDFSDGEVKTLKEYKKISRPDLKSVSPHNFFWDSEATCKEDMRFAGEFAQVQVDEILHGKGYNGPDMAKFKAYVAEKELKGTDYVNTIEYWTPKSVAVIVEEKFLVKDHATPYKHNHLPYHILVKFPDQRKPVGISTLETITDNIEYMNMLVNNHADNLKLMMNKMFTLESSSDIDIDEMRAAPGRVVRVRSAGEFKEIPMTPLPVNVEQELATQDSFINRTIGNLDYIQAEKPGPITATESKIIDNRSVLKQKSYVVFNREEFLKPFLRDWIELNQQFLTAKDAVELLGEKKAQDLMLESAEVDLNTRLDIKVSGDPGMVDRAQALADMGEIVQVLQALTEVPPGVLDLRKVVGWILSKYASVPQDVILGPDEVAAEQEAQEESGSDAIADEISAAASELGVTPDVLITQLAERLKITPEEVSQGIYDAGSFNAYLQAVAAQNGG